ncbi:hypothetical protein ABZ815_15480 [Nonomuraea sp. NPDC047529]|uniref:hypothetical protein n=1 Tax=Nonomuraea sp. NPDC047529 TaxID=3155623 RepID=UPI0033F57B6E
MEQSAEGPRPGRRRATGRHAALRELGRADSLTGEQPTDPRPTRERATSERATSERATSERAEVQAGRGRHGRRRRGRTGKRGLTAGAIALAGGVALLLGLNGALGGTVTALGVQAGAEGDTARQDPAADSRVPANAGRAPANGKGAADAREQQKGEARLSTSPTDSGGSGAPAQTGTADPAGKPGTESATKPDAVPGKADTVQGRTDTGDAEVSVPEADDPAGHKTDDSAGRKDDSAGRKRGDSAGFKADGPSRHTDREAVEYFRARWGPGDKAMKHLKDIRTIGGYLRIYTNLPDSADNSRTAITLCKRGLEFLRANGVKRPIVFVQAEFGENGNPVLANILGPSDRSCRVTYPRPN